MDHTPFSPSPLFGGTHNRPRDRIFTVRCELQSILYMVEVQGSRFSLSGKILENVKMRKCTDTFDQRVNPAGHKATDVLNLQLAKSKIKHSSRGVSLSFPGNDYLLAIRGTDVDPHRSP
ncbi:hypothetical protein AVEN_225679-1 [Araneus ventricosus]|uniref:Uncharacterized protein n=1 Tax=Araneus ventricosus TaxID=182803 RepID=A0A4Y2X849_ARAVE|nr:hypothetical protein AVEN_225679-1 [Araneus ventricosus]